MTGSNMARTFWPDFSNNQAKLQDYYVYSGNNSQKVGKDPYYDATNLSNSAWKLVARHAKEKVWETANALNIDQTKVH